MRVDKNKKRVENKCKLKINVVEGGGKVKSDGENGRRRWKMKVKKKVRKGWNI